jgi:hypothetical protein
MNRVKKPKMQMLRTQFAHFFITPAVIDQVWPIAAPQHGQAIRQ